MTITLAIGVQRMAARHAIIRRLPAVETLGSVSVICSDKTGTLTRNEMTVQSIATPGRDYGVTGVGYEPDGEIRPEGETLHCEAEAEPALAGLLRAALLCNDASLRKHEGAWRVAGDPMEAALLTLAAKAGLDAAETRARHPRAAEIPFDAAYRFMATLHEDRDGGGLVIVKGAPERLLDMCAQELGPDGPRAIDRSAWEARLDALASRGQRVLAFAQKLAAASRCRFSGSTS